MELEITREIQNENDWNDIKKIDDDISKIGLSFSKTFFAYISNKLCGVLYYKNIEDKILLEGLYVHQKLNKENNSKSYNIGSKLIYEMMLCECGKSISFTSSVDAIGFYKKLGFISSGYMRGFSSGDKLSQIKKNLELRLKSPGYISLTEDDLVRLGI